MRWYNNLIIGASILAGAATLPGCATTNLKSEHRDTTTSEIVLESRLEDNSLNESPIVMQNSFPQQSVNTTNNLENKVSEGLWFDWVSLPNSAPVGIISYGEYPAPPQMIQHPAYPDSIMGGKITVNPYNELRTVGSLCWAAPTTGSPVEYYETQLSFCEDCDPLDYLIGNPDDPIPDLTWSIVFKARVRGVDAQARAGLWSEPSEAGVLLLPELQMGEAYKVSPQGVLEMDGEHQNTQNNQTGFIGSNSPNPYNAQTIFNYAIPTNARFVSDIAVYDIRGRLIDKIKTIKSPGEHTATFNPDKIASGLYLAQITIDGQNYRLKTILTR